MFPPPLSTTLSSNLSLPPSSIPEFVSSLNDIDPSSPAYSNFAKASFSNAICQYDPLLAPIQPNFQIGNPELRVVDHELNQLLKNAENNGLQLRSYLEFLPANQPNAPIEPHSASLFSDNNPYFGNTELKEQKEKKETKREYKLVPLASYRESKSSSLQWRSKSPELVTNNANQSTSVQPERKIKERRKKVSQMTLNMAKKILNQPSKCVINPYIPLPHFPDNFANSTLGQSVLKIMPEIRKRILEYRLKPQNIVRGIYVLFSSGPNFIISSSYKACSDPLHPYYKELRAQKVKYANVLEAIKVYRPQHDILIRSPNQVFYYIKNVLKHPISQYMYKKDIGWVPV